MSNVSAVSRSWTDLPDLPELDDPEFGVLVDVDAWERPFEDKDLPPRPGLRQTARMMLPGFTAGAVLGSVVSVAMAADKAGALAQNGVSLARMARLRAQAQQWAMLAAAGSLVGSLVQFTTDVAPIHGARGLVQVMNALSYAAHRAGRALRPAGFDQD